MPNSLDHVLDIQRCYMRYPTSHRWTLEGLNLKIAARERLALVGPSGCGKSTVARVALQLLPPGSRCKGELTLCSQDPRKMTPAGLRKLRGNAVGLVFQDPMTRLNPLLTIGDHLVDTIRAHRPHKSAIWIRKKADALLEKVGISSLRFCAYPHEFSGGMRQRLAIALAIALDPPLVIADEPTTSLDVAIADQIMFELSKLCNEIGSALLLITHDLPLAIRWCERISIMDQGRIVEEAPCCEFVQSPQSDLGKRLVKVAREKEQMQTSTKVYEELVLEVQGLRCWHALGGMPWSLNWLKAVDNVNFSLHAGETLGVVGASGCGKSTLCRALIGLAPIKGGVVKLQGQNIMHMKGHALKRARQSLQMVFQDPLASLNPKMTVAETICDPLLIHKRFDLPQARERSRQLLQQVGLVAPENFQDRFPYQLSGGQQQRVAIARALALEPKVLICDESVSMLDVEIQTEVLNLLQLLQRRLGVAILFITHDLSLASGFCHRVLVLDQGQIVEEGSGKEFLDSPQAAITRKLVDVCPRFPLGG